jgi:phosphohistidine phosphatase
MPKTLLALRHAKSPHVEDVADHDRPLFAHARQQIADLAKQLAGSGLVPDVVLSSTAVRAAETARAYSAAAGGPEPILLAGLYEPGDPQELLAAIQTCGGSAAVVLVVGHNPGMEEFCNLLTRHPEVDRFGTATLAVFEVAINSWTELRFGLARLQRLTPSH